MAIPTRQMSKPQVRPMQPFRQQQSQALRPAVQQPMQQPMQRAMQQPMQRAQTMQQPMQQRSQPMQQQQRGPMVQRPQAMQPTPTRVQQPIRQPPPSQPIRSGPFVPPPMHPNEDRGRDYMPPRTGGGPAGDGTGGYRPPMQPGGTFDANDVMANPEKYGMDPRAIAAQGADKFSQYLKDAQAQETKYPGSTFFSQPRPGPNMTTPPGGGTDPYANAQPMPKPVVGNLGPLPGAYENNVASVQGKLNMQPGGGIGMMTPNNPNTSGMQMEKPMQVGGGGVGMMMPNNPNETGMTMGAFKRGGQIKAYAKGGKVAKPVAYAKGGAVKASSRGDGIAQRGKTKGKIY